MKKDRQTVDPKLEKNLQALFAINPVLAKKVSKFQSNERYEIFQGKDPIDINFLDTKTNRSIYVSPVREIEEFLQNEEKNNKLPFRYFFGVGNSIGLHTLCDNSDIKRIVVIEPSIELIYIALNLLDFSKHIISGKLSLFDSDSMDSIQANITLQHTEGKLYVKLFKLEMFTSYYEYAFNEELKKISTIMSESFYRVIATHGNCAIDSLIGTSHQVKNLPKMIQHQKIQDFRNKTDAKTAIIVSTGPSLSKQLPLLKKIKDYVTIICIDASFPILEKHGIKPDFVTTIERVPESAKFYKNIKKSFQDGVNFILVSVVHEDVLNAIKGGNIILQMRPHLYAKYFKLDEFGYLGEGMSAANLAHELAFHIGSKNIILIGQDLAFGENDASHAAGHVYGEKESDINKYENYIEKYGGNGKIKTTPHWILFKSYFESTISSAKKYHLAETFNATQGGARILGSIEITFDDAIKKLVNTSVKKKPIKVRYPTKKDQKRYVDSFIDSLNVWIKDSIKRQVKTEEVFLKIQQITEEIIEMKENNNLDKLSIEKLLPYLDIIDSIKYFFEDKFFNTLYKEVVQTYILSIELDLISIPLKKATTQEENIVKIVDWIMQHAYWLFALAGGMQAIRDTILQASETWDEELQKRLVVPTKKEFPIDEKKFQELKKRVEEEMTFGIGNTIIKF